MVLEVGGAVEDGLLGRIDGPRHGLAGKRPVAFRSTLGQSA